MKKAWRSTGGDEVLKQCGWRIGLLGGTFDPIHNGHLRLADHVLKVLDLDSILFIPSARPPHKGHVKVTSFKHRSAMVRIATRDSRFFVTDMEAQRSGPSYSVDTLKELRDLLDQDVSLFFIIGMDAFVELSTWKNCTQLLDYANLAIIPRPDYPLGLISHVVDRLGRYSFDSARSYWIAPDHLGRIYPVDIPLIDISSTDIREKAVSGAPLDGLLPAAVSEYILQHDLFSRS